MPALQVQARSHPVLDAVAAIKAFAVDRTNPDAALAVAAIRGLASLCRADASMKSVAGPDSVHYIGAAIVQLGQAQARSANVTSLCNALHACFRVSGRPRYQHATSFHGMLEGARTTK